MFDFAPTFEMFEESVAEKSTAVQKEGTGQQSSPSLRSRSVLKFRQSDSQESAGEASLGGSQMGSEGGLEPRDPVAYPSYKTRAEGAAHPIYQLCEEPLRVKAVQRQELPVSQKTEVDIAMFLEAVSSAFPRPRDPLMPRVLRARPKKAARPFLYVAEKGNVPNEPATEDVPETSASPVQVEEHVIEKDVVEKATPILTLQERTPFDVPYDPILEWNVSPVERLDNSADAKATKTVEAPYDPILEGAQLPISRGKAVEVNSVRPVEAHERALIDARIEPLEPVAKPRFPLPSEVPGAAQPRLSPSQRAHLRRPTVVHDCHGRLTPVNYSLNPQRPDQD